MDLHLLDWALIVGYALFALAVGLYFRKRAGEDIEEFFLSGRTLPWWIAGTSMVATTFASDTPLVISGWVRTDGIWQNWQWWTTATCGMITVFLFARYWRRGEVVTAAELAELRYGGGEAKVLRGFLGVYQSLITNTIILCWVIVAAKKIMAAVFGIDPVVAVASACALALVYSVLSGFWGVVVTDVVQFTMAMIGAVVLAAVVWGEVGGTSGVLEAAAAGAGGFTPDTLRFFPAAGEGSFFDASFWTVSFATVFVFLGVQWWAYEYVDGGILAVQRISAAKSERDGMLAYLWYAVAHFALRPWPWIMVGIASLIVFPRIEVRSPVAGTVTSVEAEVVQVLPDGAKAPLEWTLPELGQADEPKWYPKKVAVSVGSAAKPTRVKEGDLIASTDPESAYLFMMGRFLGLGLLGLVVASLLAAFMSTIDTHVNLASSFFVNDVYRRFVRPDGTDKHYVLVARLASAGVLAIGAALALQNDSISFLFGFFMSFLAGLGPVYVARWLWWRVRASSEIVAILTSSIVATWLAFVQPKGWDLGALSDGGVLTAAGRLLIVVAASLTTVGLSLLLTKARDPRDLVEFYRRVRPIGWWGPVRELCPDVPSSRPEVAPIVTGSIAGIGMIYGLLFAVGSLLLGRTGAGTTCAAVAAVCALLVARSLRQLRSTTDTKSSTSTGTA